MDEEEEIQRLEKDERKQLGRRLKETGENTMNLSFSPASLPLIVKRQD